jgi:hypothetical protein
VYGAVPECAPTSLCEPDATSHRQRRGPTIRTPSSTAMGHAIEHTVPWSYLHTTTATTTTAAATAAGQTTGSQRFGGGGGKRGF